MDPKGLTESDFQKYPEEPKLHALLQYLNLLPDINFYL